MSRNRPLRLVATVILVDDQGARHAFGPDDVVPGWARSKITNPKAWGRTVRQETVKQSDYGATPDELLDIVCSQGHPKRIIARFEWDAVDSRWRWRWRWTASLAMSQPGDSAGAQEDWLNSVRDNRRVVRRTPDGRVQVRLRCRHCGKPDVQVGQALAHAAFSEQHAAGVSEVELVNLSRTTAS